LTLSEEEQAMPTDLPESHRPTNPGTDKIPEDPSEAQRKKIIEDTKGDDLPNPVPDSPLGPGVGGVPGIL
jgi:hypothetical protein